MTINPDQPAAKKKSLPARLLAEVEPARAAMALGVVFVGAVLVALGIQGDLLISMIRNAPAPVAIAFSLVLVGLALPFFKGTDKVTSYFPVLGLVVLIAGTITTVSVAVSSLTVREQPTLSAKVDWSNDAPTEGGVTVTTSATSLQARDDVLLRVVGVVATPGISAREECVSSSWAPLPGSTLLYWGTSGPSKGGAATISATVRVSSDEFDYVCAYAGLRSHADTLITDRWTTALITLQ